MDNDGVVYFNDGMLMNKDISENAFIRVKNYYNFSSKKIKM